MEFSSINQHETLLVVRKQLSLRHYMDLITGKWIGEYIYGEGYGEDLRGKSVQFTIELFLNGDLITGTCIDEETKDIFSEPAKIEGTFENGTILFYLTHSIDSVMGDKNKAENYSSTSIQYSGVLKKSFFRKAYYFEGTWDIDESVLDVDGVWQHYSVEGTWTMRKAS